MKLFGLLAGAAFVLAVAFVLMLVFPAKAAGCPPGFAQANASWYGNEHHGRLTASGEVFNEHDLTAAMPVRFMLGLRVQVLLDGKSVTVRINDLGPNLRLRRDIDLSRGAAERLGMIEQGMAVVCLRVIGRDT